MRPLVVVSSLFMACAASAPPPVMIPPFGGPATEDVADLRLLTQMVETRKYTLGRPVAPEPLPDGSQVLFLRASATSPVLSLYAFDVATGQTREVVTPAQLAGGANEELGAEERARRERMRVTLSGFTSYQISDDGSHVLLALGGRLYMVAIATGAAVAVAGPDAQGQPPFDARLSPDGTLVAFVRGGELFTVSTGGGPERQLTRGASGEVSHARAEFVAQEELDRYTGYWWSPDSTELVYEVADSAKVEKLYQGDPAVPMAPFAPVPYPRPGHANVEVRLAVIPVQGGAPVLLDWDRSRYPYLTDVTWAAGSPLTITVMTRDQRELVLLQASPRTGQTRPLLTERDDDWVNVTTHEIGFEHAAGGRYRQYQWLRDGSGFLWATERAGAWQLELRAPDGALVRTLTPLGFGFRAIKQIDLAARTVVVAAAAEPVDQQLWRLSLDGGVATPLTPPDVVAIGNFARQSSAFVLQRTSAAAILDTEVYRADGSLAGLLPSVAESPAIEPKVEITKRGDYWTAVVRPTHFEPGRKYPVIVYVYGGPHVTVVKRSKFAYIDAQFLADHGFIVIFVDNRGTPNRDRAWERAVYGKFAEVPLAGQVEGLRALAAHEPAIDLERVGVYGSSFGGYLAALAVLRRPDVYKAAVSVAPVTDWLEYDTCYTERYLGVPTGADDKRYSENGLIAYAAELSRPLLLVHGTADDNVHLVHTLRLGDALFRAGRYFELLTLAGQTHVPREPNLMLRYYQRLFEFFRRTL